MFKKIALLVVKIWLIQTTALQAQDLVKRLTNTETFPTGKIGNVLLFISRDETGMGLWRTDGTASGTTLIKTLNLNYASYTNELFTFKGNVYFSAMDDVMGPTLWKTNGTAAGTVKIRSFPRNSGLPGQFTNFNGALVFVAYSDSYYSALWKTDGTTAGTVKVSSNTNSGISSLTVAGDYLYYLNGNTLYRTDGIAASIKKIAIDGDTNPVVTNLLSHSGKISFTTYSSYTVYGQQNIKLYTLASAATKPVLLKEYKAVTYGELYADNFTAAGNDLYFSLRTVDGNSNATDAVWKSDGTATGTQVVKTFSWNRHTSASNAQNFIWFNNKMYFSAPGAHEFWETNGTEGGTVKTGNIYLPVSRKPIEVNNKLYLIAAQGGSYNGMRLYSYAGTGEPVKELDLPENPDQLFEAGGIVYLLSKKTKDYNSWSELWTNTPLPYIEVRANYSQVNGSSVINFNSLADSVSSQTVIVGNRGNKELKISEISISGAPFYLGGKPDQVIQPGKQTSFKLAYLTGQPGQSMGTLAIRSTSGANGAMFIKLTGNAAAIAKKPMILPPDELQKRIIFNEYLPQFSLSNKSVNENMAVNTVVGAFPSTTAADKYKFELVAGAGDADNSSFKIQNGQLLTSKVFDFEGKSDYTIRVKGSNAMGALQKSFIIQVADVQENQAPVSCSLTAQGLNYALYDVAYIGSRLIAVGSNSNIIASDNDGQTWQKINAGSYDNYSAIQVIDSKTAYIFGGSKLLKTEDGGSIWFPVEIPSSTISREINKMYFHTAQTGYLLSDGGYYKTTDGGRNWQYFSAYSGRYVEFYSACFTSDSNGFLGGWDASLLRTKNGGKTWERIMLPGVETYSNSVTSITFIDNNLGYVATSRGHILQTTDGGTTWRNISQLDSGNWRLNFFTKKIGTALAVSGSLYKTVDGGVNWTIENNGYSANGLAVNAAKNKFCLVSSSPYSNQNTHSIFLKNGLAGAWTMRSNYVPGNIISSNFIDELNWYVFGDGNFKTTDGGITWERVNIPSESYPQYLSNSYFFNKDNGLVASSQGLHKTTNGGKTWTISKIDSVESYRALHFITPQIGFFASGTYLYRTADGGQKWTKTRWIGNPVSRVSYSFVNENTGYLCAGASTVFKTTDKGLTWTAKSITGGYYLHAVHFFDELNGLAGGSNGKLIKTTDGGQTWKEVQTQIYSQSILSLSFITPSRGFMLAERLYETMDGGKTWKELYITSNTITGVKFVQNKVYATDSYGNIIRLGGSLLPGNAGYINGETYVEVNQKTDYNMPVVNGTYYKWTVSGAATADYGTNSITVSWKAPGKYKITATPYTNCGLGQSRTLDVTVESLPAPKIIGPATVESYSKTEYYTADNGNTYNWKLTGNDNTAANGNKFSVIWANPDTAVISVIETFKRLNIKKSASLTVAVVPSNGQNIGVKTLSATKTANSPVVSVYPNPFVSQVNINLGVATAEKAQVSVTRLSGAAVLNRDYTNSNGLISIDMSSEEAGIYILTVKHAGNTSAYKIIKN